MLVLVMGGQRFIAVVILPHTPPAQRANSGAAWDNGSLPSLSAPRRSPDARFAPRSTPRAPPKSCRLIKSRVFLALRLPVHHLIARVREQGQGDPSVTLFCQPEAALITRLTAAYGITKIWGLDPRLHTASNVHKKCGSGALITHSAYELFPDSGWTLASNCT